MRKINEEDQGQEVGDVSGSTSKQKNNIIKDGTKTAAKAAANTIVKVISKIGIRVLLPILLILVLLASFVYFITIDDATYKEGDMSSTPYVASTYIKSVTIDGEGLHVHIKDKDGNEIVDDPSTTDVNEAYQYLWDQMIKAGNTVETYLSKPEELVKMMNAEIITQYPYIDTAPSDALNGVIRFKRPKEMGESTYMTYADKATFQGYVDTYNSSRNSTAKSNAIKHFTLDDEGNVVVAKWTEVNNRLETNDSEVDPNSAGSNSQTMTTTKINYKNIVRPYTLPFNYMWAWLVIGEDKTFIFGDEEVNLKGFVDLVQNTKLDISILDNTTTVQEVDDYKYNKNVRTDTYVRLSVDESYGANYDSERYWTIDGQDNYDSQYSGDVSEEGPFYRTHTKTTIVDSLDVKLTYADTWIIKYEDKYIMPDDTNRDKTRDINSVTNSTNIPDTEYELKNSVDSDSDGSLTGISKATDFQSEVQDIIESNVDSDDYETDEEYEDAIDAINTQVSYVKQDHYQKVINNVNTVTTTTTVDKFIQDDAGAVVNPKLDKNSTEQNFMTIFMHVENTQTRTFVLEIPDWLFEILETNSDTSNMVDLTKYILNQYYGDNRFGDIDIDWLQLFKPGSFSTTKSGGISYKSLNLTASDKEILYKIVYAERGDGTQAQQEYVASVILNRVLSSKFPNTVHDVVFAPMQFQPTRNGAYDAAPNNNPTTVAAVDNVIESGDKTNGAVYFMTPEAAVGQHSWLVNCKFLFWDQDLTVKEEPFTGGGHNFYTTEEIEQELNAFKTGGGGGDFVNNAISCHEYVRTNGYSYALAGLSIPEGVENGRTIDCSSFVSWVAYKTGFTEFAGHQAVSSTFESNPWGWETISVDQVQAGDILAYDGHVEICADPNPGGSGFIVYNCGGNSSIGASGVSSSLPESSYSGHSKSQVTRALRVP